MRTPSPAPTSSTTSSGAELGQAPATPRMFSSTRKCWPRSRLGATAKLTAGRRRRRVGLDPRLELGRLLAAGLGEDGERVDDVGRLVPPAAHRLRREVGLSVSARSGRRAHARRRGAARPPSDRSRCRRRRRTSRARAPASEQPRTRSSGGRPRVRPGARRARRRCPRLGRARMDDERLAQLARRAPPARGRARPAGRAARSRGSGRARSRRRRPPWGARAAPRAPRPPRPPSRPRAGGCRATRRRPPRPRRARAAAAESTPGPIGDDPLDARLARPRQRRRRRRRARRGARACRSRRRLPRAIHPREERLGRLDPLGGATVRPAPTCPRRGRGWPSASRMRGASPGDRRRARRRQRGAVGEVEERRGRARPRGLVLGQLPRRVLLDVAVEGAHDLPDLVERAGQVEPSRRARPRPPARRARRQIR